jgi:hypothetical protein
MMLASSFDALTPFIYGIPVALLFLGVISLGLAVAGHNSAPFLSVPIAFIGLIMVSISGSSDATLPGIKLLWPTPLIIGSFSTLVWIFRRFVQRRQR